MKNASETGKRSQRRIVFNILLAFFSALLPFLLAEGGLRLLRGAAISQYRVEMSSRRELAERRLKSNDALLPYAGHPYAALHPFYGYTLKPLFNGTVRLMHPTQFATDRYGFRNGDTDYQEIPDDWLVVGVFGGSGVFGDGIQGNENTIAGRMEAYLRARFGPKVRVLNFGVPGWHYPQQFFAMTRTLNWLDAAVFCDGINDLTVPYWNMTQTSDGRFFPDYPSGFTPRFISPASSPDMVYLSNRLLRFDAAYSPSSLLGHSALFNWIRYKRLRRLQALVEAQARQEEPASKAPQEGARDPSSVDRWVSFGIQEWTQYASRTDAIAATRSVPVLHTLQPFLNARADVPVSFDQLPDASWVHEMYRVRHPSSWWKRLRQAAREWYAHAESRAAANGAQTDFLDLSEAVSPDPANWLDCVHLSSAGCDQVAAILCDRLLKNGMIRGDAGMVPK